MALILPGGGVADIRGSIAGTTFARNHYGNYCRSRTKPINPNTQFQIDRRDAMSFLSTYWREGLDATQRAGWNAYAATTSWLNALGQTIHLTGQAMYVRSAMIRWLNAESILEDAPTTPGIPPQQSSWTPTFNISTNNVSIAFTFTTNVAGQDRFFFVGRPISVGRSSFSGPWRFLGGIHGSAGTPPTSPQAFDYPWFLGASQTVHIYCRQIDADGRTNEPFQQSGTPA